MKHTWVDCQTLSLVVGGERGGKRVRFPRSVEGRHALREWQG